MAVGRKDSKGIFKSGGGGFFALGGVEHKARGIGGRKRGEIFTTFSGMKIIFRPPLQPHPPPTLPSMIKVCITTLNTGTKQQSV